MKNNSILLLMAVIFTPVFLFGSIDISGAMDSRLEIEDFGQIRYMLHGAEVNLRYTYADARGDRLIGFIQLPYAQHWKSDMFLYHYGDAYVIVKGALHKPNIKIGRFDMPFGLLKTFDSHFTLLPQLFEPSLGIKKDIGVTLFGNYKSLTYDLSLTQGFNSFEQPRYDQPVSTRIGLENQDINIGLSYYLSTHVMDDMLKMERVGIDFEKNFNPIILRGEGAIGNNPDGRGFTIMLDFPCFYGIEGRGSGLFWRAATDFYAYGLEFKKDISFFNFGLGIISGKRLDSEIKVIAQLVVKL